MRLSAIFVLVFGLLLAPWSHAEDSAGNAPSSQTALQGLPWVSGPATVPLFGNSTLTLPAGYRYLDAAGTAKLSVLTHTNVTSPGTVTLAPQSFAWLAVMNFHGGGLVKDDDAALDEDALLGGLQKQAKRENKERERNNLLPLPPTAWAVQPAYDSATRRAQWAAVYNSPGQEVAHYTVAILGRRGFTQVSLSSSPAAVHDLVPAVTAVLAGYEFTSGERYEDWQPGDPLAPYALADVVIGRTQILTPVNSIKGVLTLALIGVLLLLLLVIFLLLWAVPRMVRKGIETLTERYKAVAKQVNPNSKPDAGEELAAGGEPDKEKAKPVAASALERSAVGKSEKAKALALAAIPKNPLFTLLVIGSLFFTYHNHIVMDFGILVLFGVFLGLRGAAIPKPEDTAAIARRKRIGNACALAMAPVVLGLCAVVMMMAVFEIFSHDFHSTRVIENHVSYLVQSEEWTALFATAAIALAAGLPLLGFVGASLRPTLLRGVLMAALSLIVWAGTFACVAPVPIRGEDEEEAQALETRKKAEGEDTQKAALQALYIAVQNLSPRDARYYRTLFVEINEDEPYPEHAKLLQAMITDKMADTAGTDSPAALPKTDVAEVLKHHGHLEASFAVVRDLLGRQIGADTLEVKGLAGTLVEQIVDTQARQLFSAEVNLINPDEARKAALAEAQKTLHVLAAHGDSKIDVEGVRIELQKAAKEVKENDEKKERVEKLKDFLKEKVGGGEKEKTKK